MNDIHARTNVSQVVKVVVEVILVVPVLLEVTVILVIVVILVVIIFFKAILALSGTPPGPQQPTAWPWLCDSQ